MGCGGSTVRPESPAGEAPGQSGATGLETPAADDLRASALNELKTILKSSGEHHKEMQAKSNSNA